MMTDAERDHILRTLWASGVVESEIARRVFMSRPWVSYRAQRLGLPQRRRGQRKGEHGPLRGKSIEVRARLASGESYRSIAESLGVSYQAVYIRAKGAA